ncbi:MAG: F0F1 ATP synthase subunit A [Phycisphaerales bacterium]
MIGSMFILAEGPNPVGHVADHPFWVTDDGWVLWSGHMGNLVLSGLILVLLFPYLANKIAPARGAADAEAYVPRNRLAQLLEVFCVYLRENTVRPLLGDRTDFFIPFLWTLFFFVLINNLLGLIPWIDAQHLLLPYFREHHIAVIGGTATQSLWVTGLLAFISFLVINIAGIRRIGLVGYLKHLTAGTPWFLWWLMVPIEILGTFIKPVALAIRLFANMTAGHILLATLFIFVGMALAGNLLIGAPVTLISVAGAVAIYFLELFVAFLQAFVFMFLTTVFIAQLDHHDHDHSEVHSPEAFAGDQHDHAAPHPHGDAPGPTSPVPA